MSLKGVIICAIICAAYPVHVSAYSRAVNYNVDSLKCVEEIGLKVETGAIKDSQSKTAHNLQLKIGDYLVSIPIPCNQHSYICKENAAVDLVFTLADYCSLPAGCVRPHDIAAVSLKEGGNDGWFLKSIYTTYITKSGRELPLTVDKDFDKWLDGNDASDRLEYQLTMIGGSTKSPDFVFFN